MSSLLSSAKILIATDIFEDAQLVRGILSDEFDHVFISTDADKVAIDFINHQPDLLILGFNRLERSERYYLSLYRLYPELHEHPHRTVILSNQDEVKRIYELCMKDIFDDYVLFWPMAHDSTRLNMSIHNALRELTSSKSAGPSIAEFALQSFRLAELEQLLDHHVALAETDIETASHTKKQAKFIGPTLLIVDDDKFQHKVIGKLLEDENYHLIFAASGIEALILMQKKPPDIILMDVMMPDMDGIETMKNLKAIPQLIGIPVIMITGKSEGQVVADSLKAGAADFVVKPFNRTTLIAKIDHALSAIT